MRLGAALIGLSGVTVRASNQLVTVAVTLFATRFLSPASFGVFALASLAITFIRTMLHTGAFEFLLKAPAANECSSECLANNALLAIVLCLLAVLGILVATYLFGPSRLALIVLLLLPSNLIAAIGAWREALLLRTGRLTLYYGLTMMAELAAGFAAIAALFSGKGVFAFVYQIYVRNILLLLLYTSTGPAELSAKFRWSKVREISNWSTSRYASLILNFAGSYGIDVFLGVFLSPAATGLYRASSRLVTAVSDVFAQPIKLIAQTTFSARAARGRSSHATWPAMVALIAVVGGSALAGVAVVGNLVVPLILGNQWSKVGLLLPILAVDRAASLFDAVTSTLLVAYNHQRTVLNIQIIGSLIGVLPLFIAAPYGLVAIIVAVTATALIARGVFAVITIRLVPPAGASRSTLLLTIVVPIATTVAGSLIAQVLARAGSLGALASAWAAIAGGAAAWGLAVLLLRHRIGELAIILDSTD